MATGVSTDYAAVTAYLFGLKAAHGLKFGVDRMRDFAAELGHPEQGLDLVHVAGTNGKGSVVAMLEAILHAAGWRTGMYTSPHLVKLGERVQVDRHLLSPDEITAYVAELRPVAERLARGGPDDHPSYFEFMTAMALLQFRRKGCDIGLLEVGLGGRLDATNIVSPLLSIITSIGMDHCEMLGNSFAEIAAEKAGIIKPGRPVIMGRMPPEAEVVVRERADLLQAPLRSVRETYGEDLENYPHTNLEGDYQRWNAATATLAARVLGEQWRINDAFIARGLAHVDWPGRWQRVQLGPRLLILDASHNPEGAQVLDSNLRHLEAETGRKPVVITGVLGTTRAQPLVEVIARHAREIHLVVPKQPRACSHAELAALVPVGYTGPVIHSDLTTLFPDASHCTAGTSADVLVFTGSIYLIGEVMARLNPQSGPGEGRLQDF
ncbi:MAG: bifunctional folylpolyglutamate synthase/dihydrofolate synthase [Cephaloticoccus sp.]|nr:bifunctional folylpolyglutamate synthase/dihydrofolate synthase [Cephaloticoccus sp.]